MLLLHKPYRLCSELVPRCWSLQNLNMVISAWYMDIHVFCPTIFVYLTLKSRPNFTERAEKLISLIKHPKERVVSILANSAQRFSWNRDHKIRAPFSCIWPWKVGQRSRNAPKKESAPENTRKSAWHKFRSIPASGSPGTATTRQEHHFCVFYLRK